MFISYYQFDLRCHGHEGIRSPTSHAPEKLEIKDIENFYRASINLRDVLKFALEYILMLK